MCYSISCQAICDAPGMFIDVEIKCPGSVHGAFAYYPVQILHFRKSVQPENSSFFTRSH